MLRRLITAAALLAAALTTLPAGAASAADTPLRDLAAARGVHLGTAVTSGRLTGGYADVAGGQFGPVAPPAPGVCSVTYAVTGRWTGTNPPPAAFTCT
ncbi:hypothetical protein [Streptomyces wedmorensis]|uniref:hypothetical protein n=1 Tax=Streptomyces wedmorensis TaxID=43759 RepID=UPI0037943E24